MFPGTGTLVNAATVLVGASLGVLLGHRLPARTRDVVTDALGLVTLLIAASTAAAVNDPALREAVGSSAPVLIVLGSLVIGGVLGSLVGIESALERFAAWLRGALLGTRGGDRRDRERFVEGFVSSSLLFCVGPLTVLGSLSDGLGRGADQLYLKSALDGFASIAFAASFGWGVAASALAVLLVEGSLTLVGLLLGDVLPAAQVAALSATGALMLVGVALGLLRLRQLPVGDLLPALVIAPLLTALVTVIR
ncbi:MAG: uncharacterized protein QOK15_375 [Nocardioidaceae bacterium]|nr:uncharacterized protein [Nocardioidaceae bacterium]